MKNLHRIVCTCMAVVGLNYSTTVRAAEGASTGVKFHLDTGLTYVNGAYDVNRALKASLVDNSFTIQRDYVVPIGLSLNPRVEFANGLGLGLSAGPTSFIAVQKNAGFNVNEDISYIIPVGGFVQYNFLRDKNISPYVRAGVKYPITGGDFIKSGTVGAYGVVGVEFFKQKRVGVGFEVGYDSSRVTVSAGASDTITRKVTPTGFTASLVVFF